jgi:hypothetical protein
MIDFLTEARRHVREKYGDKYAVLKDSIVDSDRFYCFTFQSNEFIRTGDYSTMAVGQGYTIINKKDNRIFDFGSRHSLDQALKVLDENLWIEDRIKKHKPEFELGTKYDLRINSIKKRQTLIEKLKASGLTYIIPEIVGDSIFRIAKTYDLKGIEKRLNELPVVFHGISDELTLIDDLLSSDCGDFDLPKHQDKSLAKYVDRATEEDLQPIW